MIKILLIAFFIIVITLVSVIGFGILAEYFWNKFTKKNLKKLFCHHKWKLEMRIRKDIRDKNLSRYLYQCKKCDKVKHEDIEDIKENFIIE